MGLYATAVSAAEDACGTLQCCERSGAGCARARHAARHAEDGGNGCMWGMWLGKERGMMLNSIKKSTVV